MFFFSVLGFVVYGNEVFHFRCESDQNEVNFLSYNQFKPVTPQAILLFIKTINCKH